MLNANTKFPLLFSEVKDLGGEVAHLITTLQLVRISVEASTASEADKDRGIAAFNRLLEIGNRLTQELVSNTHSLNALLDKWLDHGYRPSLRAQRGTPEKLLADIYDIVALVYRLDVQAYRQGFNADGHR